MANGILTPTNSPNLFGPGKPGFNDNPLNGPATAFDASWCNGIQESVVRTIEAAGLVPDGADFDQFTDAIGAFPLVTPTVATSLTMLGGSSLILNDTANLILEDSSLLYIAPDSGNGGSRIQIAAPDGKLTADDGSIVELLGDATCGTSSANVWNFNATTNFNAITTFTEAVNLGDDAGDIIGVFGTPTVHTQLTMNAQPINLGVFSPASDGDLARTSDGEPLFRVAGTGKFAFGGTNGEWVEADADQVAATAVAATTLLTTSSKNRVRGLLRIRVSGEMQRSVAGVNTISIEQDQGTSTWIPIDNGGVTTKGVTTVDTSNANDWTVFQIERTFGTGVTDTFFRLVVDANASTARIRDTHLVVRRLGA